MKKNDVSSQASEGKFNYRVGAIIMDSEKILMATNSGSNHYYTVGGRVKFGETAEEAVLRESFEETDVQLEIDKLVFIQENFFIMESSKEKFHEIVFYYLMKDNKKIKETNKKVFKEEYDNVILDWYTIGNLDKMIIYPDFLKTELLKLSQNIKHFITKDGKTKEDK